jgi:hypothetical protein
MCHGISLSRTELTYLNTYKNTKLIAVSKNFITRLCLITDMMVCRRQTFTEVDQGNEPENLRQN